MNAPATKRVLLSIADANKLLEYLSNRPYKEVAPLVQAITSSPLGEIQSPPPEAQPPAPALVEG